MGLFDSFKDLHSVDELSRTIEGRGTLDPNRYLRQEVGGGKDPEKPDPTAEQLALERRQQAALDKETEEIERRAKMMARSRLGANTLLSGAEPTQERAVTRGASSGAGASGGSLLGGGSSGSGGGGGSSTGSVGRGFGTSTMRK